MPPIITSSFQSSPKITAVNSNLILTTCTSYNKHHKPSTNCSLWRLDTKKCIAQIDINPRNRDVLCDGTYLFIINPKEIIYARINDLTEVYYDESDFIKIKTINEGSKTISGFSYLIPNKYLTFRLCVHGRAIYYALSLNKALKSKYLSHVTDSGTMMNDSPVSMQLNDGSLLYSSKSPFYYQFKDGVESCTKISCRQFDATNKFFKRSNIHETSRLFPIDKNKIAIIKKHYTLTPGDKAGHYHGTSIIIYDIDQAKILCSKTLEKEVYDLSVFAHGGVLADTRQGVVAYQAPNDLIEAPEPPINYRKN